MADRLKLLVADDRATRLDRWIERLKAVSQVIDRFDEPVRLTGDDLEGEIDELSKRRAAARRDEEREEESSVFDDADLLIVDYDLTDLEGHSTETGVGVAYLARCFSECGFIVALNQFGDNPFDLSGLGDYAGFADLDLGGDQLDNPGLWAADGEWPEFRPWGWPLLPAEITRLSQITDQVEQVGLDAPIFDALQLRGRLGTALAPEVAAPLGHQDPERATFRTLLGEPSMGLRREDKVVGVRREARAAAARTSQWLERWVMAAQDRLIDAPHLAVRYWSQVEDEALVVRNVSHADPVGLDEQYLAAHRLQASDWLSRPAWWATAIAGDERIPEVADPWEAEPAEKVFCEDVSRFVLPEEAIAYRVEVPADSRLRYVRRLQEVDYRPMSNFAQV
jgi:hypothetical protein